MGIPEPQHCSVHACSQYKLKYETLWVSQKYDMYISDAYSNRSCGQFSVNSMQPYVFQKPVGYDTHHLNMTSVLLTLGW